MAVEKITAWQTSTGQAYAKKSEAYHEEMVHLLRTRSDTNLKGINTSAFDDALALQEDLINALIEMKSGLSPAGKQDQVIREELNKLLEGATFWLESAQKIKVEMDKES